MLHCDVPFLKTGFQSHEMHFALHTRNGTWKMALNKSDNCLVFHFTCDLYGQYPFAVHLMSTI